MRIWYLVLLVACSPGESRLDPLLAPRAVNPDPPPRASGPERTPDEKDRELERRLRELSTRPGPDRGVPLDQALGTVPGPFGPLAVLGPTMTRADVLAALPTAQRDGDLLWVPTGIERVTVEILFDPSNRLEEIRYHVPLAARPVLVTAWGPPIIETNMWFDRERRWRARLGEDAFRGKIVLGISGYTPFAEIIGRGPDGLAEQQPIIGTPLRELAASLGARLRPPAIPGAPAELLLPGATDVCSDATRLLLPITRTGRVERLVMLQCYDEDDHNRRGSLALMEQAWGKAAPTRTQDDRLVFAWSLPGRRIEAQQIQLGGPGAWIWEISITSR